MTLQEIIDYVSSALLPLLGNVQPADITGTIALASAVAPAGVITTQVLDAAAAAYAALFIS